MTTYWAILVIYYSTNVSGIGDLQTQVALPSYKQCGQAMRPILDVVKQTYPDAWAHCQETTTMSSSVRPKPRPDGLG
jgi:hypothetical protein